MPKQHIESTPSCDPDYPWNETRDCCEWGFDRDDSGVLEGNAFRYRAATDVYDTDWRYNPYAPSDLRFTKVDGNCDHSAAAGGITTAGGLGAACIETFGNHPTDHPTKFAGWNGYQCMWTDAGGTNNYGDLGCPSQNAIENNDSSGVANERPRWPIVYRFNAHAGRNACQEEYHWYCGNNWERTEGEGTPCNSFSDAAAPAECDPVCIEGVCGGDSVYDPVLGKCVLDRYPPGDYWHHVRDPRGRLYTVESDWGDSGGHQVIFRAYSDASPETAVISNTLSATSSGSGSISLTDSQRIDVFYAKSGAIKYRYSQDLGHNFSGEQSTNLSYERGIHAVTRNKVYYMGWLDDEWNLRSANLNGQVWENFAAEGEFPSLAGDPCAQSLMIDKAGTIRFLNFNLAGELVVSTYTPGDAAWVSSNVLVDGLAQNYFRAAGFLDTRDGMLVICFFETDSPVGTQGKLKIRVATRNDVGDWVLSAEQDFISGMSSVAIHMPSTIRRDDKFWEVINSVSFRKCKSLPTSGVGSWVT